MNSVIHQQIITLLESKGIQYELVKHVEEGRTEKISAIRGNELQQAAKAMVLELTLRDKSKKYVLAVLPGDSKLETKAIAKIKSAQKVQMAPPGMAQQLTQCAMGAVPPFSFDENLQVVVDKRLFENDRIVFNAGRLDCSIFMSAADYQTALGEHAAGNISKAADSVSA